MKIRVTFEVTDDDRRAVGDQGELGRKATHAEMKEWLRNEAMLTLAYAHDDIKESKR